jgi:hypothetical protein
MPMAIATAMGDCNGDGNSNDNRVGDGDRDGNGNGNGNGHSKGNHYKGRVASSCGTDVLRFWRGNTLPPPPWTQKKVHSPALHHGGDTTKSVCSPSRGRVPDSSPWNVFCFFFTTTVQFTEQPSVHPPNYSLSEIAGCAACTLILVLFSNHVPSEDGTHLFTWKPTGF